MSCSSQQWHDNSTVFSRLVTVRDSIWISKILTFTIIDGVSYACCIFKLSLMINILNALLWLLLKTDVLAAFSKLLCWRWIYYYLFICHYCWREMRWLWWLLETDELTIITADRWANYDICWRQISYDIC